VVEGTTATVVEAYEAGTETTGTDVVAIELTTVDSDAYEAGGGAAGVVATELTMVDSEAYEAGGGTTAVVVATELVSTVDSEEP